MNFCVAQRGCDICMDLPIDQPCPTCSQFPGGREMILEGVDGLANFFVAGFRETIIKA